MPGRRHARAGRSPRASEVGAQRRTGRLTAGARVTHWGASTDVCPFGPVRRGSAATRAGCPARAKLWKSLTRAATSRSASGRTSRSAVGGRVGRPPLMPRRHRRLEGASVSDRHPKGRDRLRARSPQAIERGPNGNAPESSPVAGEVVGLVDLASPEGLRESRRQVAFPDPTASLSEKRSRTAAPATWQP